MTEQPSPINPWIYSTKPLIIRALHAVIILMFAISIFSGCRAFDGSWSGVGLFNRDTYYIAHQTSGMCLLLLLPCLIIIRLFLKTTGKVTQQQVRSAWYQYATYTAHMALFLLGSMIILTGWMGAMRGGITMTLFGLISLPAPFSATRPLDVIEIYKLHKLLLDPFFGLILLHICASLFHSWILRDGLLSSMFIRSTNNRNSKN